MTAASLVIPVHGRASLTQRCLDTLLPRLPAACEAIVVDDASSDSTPALLSAYGTAVRVLSLPTNVGYARACNAGAALALHDTLVFLNNDTEALPGWLEALAAYAREHPAAEVVGAKLLYPTGSVQHAGVVIGQDGYPHNLYAGFPAQHPAVNRSRRLQAVTGACMLVVRSAFERVGGFDPAYVNSLEDVDLCMRIAEGGGEVHYCHEAVLTHLESASRGHEERFEASVARYRERWRDRVPRDDLLIYAEDGLLELEYHASYPLRVSISPLLAALDTGRESEVEAMLGTYSGQVSDLLAEVVRLTAAAGARSPAAGEERSGSPACASAADAGAPQAAREAERHIAAARHRGFLAEANRLEAQVAALQRRMQDAGAEPALDARAEPPPGARGAAFSASPRLGYRHLVERVRAAVADTVPAGAAVLVVSRGDRELVKLAAREGRHFPQDADGRYLGHHPRDSEEAIERLEDLRERGAAYLVLPSTAYWWLEHYSGFAEHLGRRYPVSDHDVCTIYRLGERRAAGARRARR
ncbi:MAG TPA: glycosyltransferase family 2 protein [Solirubrobacteraceae bacterium]|nr:glycosyltransferase family 2 protein [Solirubrobacteraceae bacterium]